MACGDFASVAQSSHCHSFDSSRGDEPGTTVPAGLGEPAGSLQHCEVSCRWGNMREMTKFTSHLKSVVGGTEPDLYLDPPLAAGLVMGNLPPLVVKLGEHPFQTLYLCGLFLAWR